MRAIYLRAFRDELEKIAASPASDIIRGARMLNNYGTNMERYARGQAFKTNLKRLESGSEDFVPVPRVSRRAQS